MTRIVLFHHVLGLTEGVRSFADTLRGAGHEVETPDLFDGRTFPDLDAGLAHVRSIGFEEVVARADAATGDVPPGVVYAGFSLGVLAAQHLLQTRPGALGALLFHGFVDPAELGGVWPDDVPVRVWAMDHDPSFVDEGDLAAAERWQQQHSNLTIVLCPGSGHLFTDPASPDYDAVATAEVAADALDVLAGLG